MCRFFQFAEATVDIVLELGGAGMVTVVHIDSKDVKVDREFQGVHQTLPRKHVLLRA